MAVSAREEILRRVQQATGDSAAAEGIEAEWQSLPRQYRAQSALSSEERLELLEDRLKDYDAGVHRCGHGGLAELIARTLETRGKQRLAVARGLPAEWTAGLPGLVEDDRGALGTLEGCDGVLTSATLAIARTGTIVLQDAPGQGRRALTLLPDYHLCVVDAATLVETVPEAIARLQARAAVATTFFSGPSATADIEMTRIKGVHGPRFVDVILLG